MRTFYYRCTRAKRLPKRRLHALVLAIRIYLSFFFCLRDICAHLWCLAYREAFLCCFVCCHWFTLYSTLFCLSALLEPCSLKHIIQLDYWSARTLACCGRPPLDFLYLRPCRKPLDLLTVFLPFTTHSTRRQTLLLYLTKVVIAYSLSVRL